jgi:hypothetical protein
MPVPQFTKEQEEAVKSFMKGQIEQQIKYDQKINPYAEPRREYPPSYMIESSKAADDKKQLATAWNMIFVEKDPARKKLFADQILSSNFATENNLMEIDTDADEIINGVPTGRKAVAFRYKDPSRNFTKVYDPSKTTLKDWSGIGTEIHGIADVNEAFRIGGGGDAGLIMGTERSNFKGVKSARAGASAIDVDAMVQSYLSSSFSQPVTEEDTPFRSAQKVKSILSKFGYDVVGETSFGTDTIKIKAPGAEKWTEFNIDDGNVDQDIQNFVIGSYDPIRAQRALSAGGVNYGNK